MTENRIWWPKWNGVLKRARDAVANLARRAYRRPVTEAELASKMQLVELARDEGDSIEEGVRLALEAILVSPNFLYRPIANALRNKFREIVTSDNVPED